MQYCRLCSKQYSSDTESRHNLFRKTNKVASSIYDRLKSVEILFMFLSGMFWNGQTSYNKKYTIIYGFNFGVSNQELAKRFS